MNTNELKQKIEGLLNECPERKDSAVFIKSEAKSLIKSFICKIEYVND